MSASRVPVPFITADQMREVDRAMVEEYGILLIQMMENAGRNLAHLARRRFLDGNPTGRKVLVLAGTGGNGGGGLVCARRLHSWGAEVQIFTTAPAAEFQGTPETQIGILERMAVPITPGFGGADLPMADLIIDAIIGYGLQGAPTGASARLIQAANAHGAPILSLDVPSGIDATTGAVHNPAVLATATLTLALPKTGLRAPAAAGHIGELYLADIGVPPELYAGPTLGLETGLVFSREEIIRLI